MPRQYKWIRTMSAKVGEPWISGWSKEKFALFLKYCLYEVMSGEKIIRILT
jgi:hypothetical protein